MMQVASPETIVRGTLNQMPQSANISRADQNLVQAENEENSLTTV